MWFKIRVAFRVQTPLADSKTGIRNPIYPLPPPFPQSHGLCLRRRSRGAVWLSALAACAFGCRGPPPPRPWARWAAGRRVPHVGRWTARDLGAASPVATARGASPPRSCEPRAAGSPVLRTLGSPAFPLARVDGCRVLMAFALFSD